MITTLARASKRTAVPVTAPRGTLVPIFFNWLILHGVGPYRSVILHLRSVMLVYVQWCFTCVQWCLSSFNDAWPTFSDVCLRSIILCLRSIILHLRSVMLVYGQLYFTYVLQYKFSSTINNSLHRGVASPAASTGRTGELPDSGCCCCILVAGSALRSLVVFIK